MIHYAKGGQVRFHQSRQIQQPFWQTTTVHVYSPNLRSTPLAIDFLRLKASAQKSIHVSVPKRFDDDLDRLPSPILIDAWGAQEQIYRRGDKLLHELPADVRPMLLLSADSDIPRGMAAAKPLLIITLWPLDLAALESVAKEAAGEAMDWGLLVPVMFPVTTDLEVLDTATTVAHENGAAFIASSSIELDAKARGAIAAMNDELDEETWATLFDGDLERIHLATERHLALVAHRHGIADVIDPWPQANRSNRAAATFLSRVGSRMVRMDHDVELGWKFLKAAGRLATLDKEIARLASFAHVKILPELEDEVIAEVVEQWLESGTAEFAEHIDAKWRVARR